MTITNYLSKADFYTYSGLTSSDVNDDYVGFIIDRINSVVVEKLTGIFDLVPSSTHKIYRNNSESYVTIGTWQSSGLVVKKGADGNATLTTLVEGDDYRLAYFKRDDSSTPVVAVNLYSTALGGREYLQVEGTKGYQDGIPNSAMLDTKLYEIVKTSVLNNQGQKDSKNPNLASEIKEGDVSVKYGKGPGEGAPTTREAIEAAIATISDLGAEYTYNKYFGLATVI